MNTIKELDTLLQKNIPFLSDTRDLFHIEYEPSLLGSLERESFLTQYRKLRSKEHLYKSTLIGPHRDDLAILQGDSPAKSYASEGQKRTFLSALKFSEWALLKENSQASPLMCIDDIGMHLDQSRKHLLKDYLKKFSQVFLTVPTDSLFEQNVDNKIE